MKWSGMESIRLATLKVPHPYDLCRSLVVTILNLFLKLSISKSLMTFLHKLTKQSRNTYQYNNSACFDPVRNTQNPQKEFHWYLQREQRAQPRSQGCRNESPEREPAWDGLWSPTTRHNSASAHL